VCGGDFNRPRHERAKPAPPALWARQAVPGMSVESSAVRQLLPAMWTAIAVKRKSIDIGFQISDLRSGFQIRSDFLPVRFSTAFSTAQPLFFQRLADFGG
jgi:hypothetical protein